MWVHRSGVSSILKVTGKDERNKGKRQLRGTGWGTIRIDRNPFTIRRKTVMSNHNGQDLEVYSS